mmetsp:Transcript_39218/g.97138  ORF Transcript_39218/g.97138 Transcript_39218/m.97138 type:complete len:227 (-) Transcript_39218:221-901(-)
MLEAAMLGIPYEPPAHRVGGGGGGGLGINGVGIGGGSGYGSGGGGEWDNGMPPLAEVAEGRFLRNEQDYAYEESLRLDRAKEAAARAKREVEELVAAEAAVKAAEEAAAASKATAERDAAIAAAANALPNEPPVGGDGVVDIAIRLPDGRRVRRRFHRSHPLRAIFAFLVSAEHLEPGSYRLVSQLPRRVFEDNTAEVEAGAAAPTTLEAVGLTAKQEALFVEMVV